MKLKSGFTTILSAALFLTACATTSKDPEPASSKASEEKSVSSVGLLGLMMGGGNRDEDFMAKQLEKASKHPLGSKENPVRAEMPRGQRAYLSRLNCENGRTPEYSRVGNVGPGPYDSIVDLYEVKCPNSAPETTAIHLDMYFPGHIEDEAVPGFTID